MKNKNNYSKFAAAILAGSLVLSACSNPFDMMAEEINGVIGGNGAQERQSEEEMTVETASTEEGTVEQEAVETLDYSHLMDKGEAETLDEGTHEVGTDITPGRYIMTASSGYGNVFMYDAEERLVVNEMLTGEAETRSHYTDRAVVFLEEGTLIEMEGLERLDFEPYTTEAVTELFPGRWVVGEDFPAGVYNLELDETESFGSMEVRNHPDHMKSRHTLGNTEYGGMTGFTTSFEEGDVVILERIPSVRLTERD